MSNMIMKLNIFYFLLFKDYYFGKLDFAHYFSKA